MKLFLLAALATATYATPFFPYLDRDGVSIQGSPLIGAHINGPGRYLFALEDIPVTLGADFDYNDVYGELIYFGDDVGAFQFNVQGGLGAYYAAGIAGFAGSRIIDGQFTLVFNTPFGEMFSGTPQVLLYKLPLESTGTTVPEPTTYALAGASLLAIAAMRTKKKRAL